MKREDGYSVYPRLRLIPPTHAFKVLCSILTGRISPISTNGSEEHIASIECRTVKVPSAATDVVSFLQTGATDGRRIIFIHGTPGSAKGWIDYLLGVPDGHTHIAMDRLGFGFSKPREGVVSLKRHAQAIGPFLEVAGTRKAILVGHSLGASVALQAALDYPEIIGGLLLLAGAFDPDLEEAHLLQPVATLKPFSWILPQAINNANRELLGLKRELIAQAGRLHEISMPVCAVHGNRDPLVPIANLYYLEQKLVNAPFEKLVLNQKDHFLVWNSKPAIDDSLVRLIDRVRRTER